MVEVTKEKTALQWHPAFYAGIQIELAKEAHHLRFENEHQLGTKPKEIDVLIIKKDSNVAIRKNIGRIFRKHNIIEYKSPEDYLSIDDFYKVHGYACFYKSDVQKVNEIKVREITISFVTKRYPSKVIKHLEREQHFQVRKQENGIYYVYGDYFPIQFIVTSQLTEEINLWLYNLTNDLKEVDRAEKLLREYRKYQHDNLHQSVMDIIVTANKKVFREANGMCQALYEIVKDQVEEQVKQQVEEQVKQRVEEQVKQRVEEQVKQQVEEKLAAIEERAKAIEKEQTLRSLVKDGLLSVAEAAKRLSMSEEEFMKKMNLAQQ